MVARHPALQPRGAARCSTSHDAELTLGEYLAARALLARLRRALPRADGRRDLVGCARQRMLELPGCASSCASSHNHGMLSVDDRPHVARRPGRLARLRRAARRARFRDRIRLRTPVAARPRADRSERVAARAAPGPPSASTTWSSPATATRRCACSRPDARRARGPRRHPVPGERGGAAHRRARCCRAAPGLGELELPRAAGPGRRAPRRGHLRMNILQGLDAPRPVLRHAEPRATRIDPAKVHPAHDATTTRSSRAAARRARRRATREISGARGTYYCGAYWGYGFHEDGVQSALARCVRAHFGARVAGVHVSSASTRAASATAASTRCRTRFGYRLFMLYLDLGELDEAVRRPLALVARAARRSRRFRRARLPRRPARAARRGGARPGRGATGRRPAGADPPAHAPALPRLRLQPGQLLLLLRRRTAERVEAIVAEITNTPWGERHAYVLAADAEHRRTAGGCASASPRTSTSRPSCRMDSAYDWRFTRARRAPRRAHGEPRGMAERVFDATLRARAPAARRARAGPDPAGSATRFMTAKVIAAIYWQALRLWLKRVPFHAHPRLSADGARPRPDEHQEPGRDRVPLHRSDPPRPRRLPDARSRSRRCCAPRCSARLQGLEWGT